MTMTIDPRDKGKAMHDQDRDQSAIKVNGEDLGYLVDGAEDDFADRFRDFIRPFAARVYEEALNNVDAHIDVKRIDDRLVLVVVVDDLPGDAVEPVGRFWRLDELLRQNARDTSDRELLIRLLQDLTATLQQQ